MQIVRIGWVSRAHRLRVRCFLRCLLSLGVEFPSDIFEVGNVALLAEVVEIVGEDKAVRHVGGLLGGQLAPVARLYCVSMLLAFVPPVARFGRVGRRVGALLARDILQVLVVSVEQWRTAVPTAPEFVATSLLLACPAPTLLRQLLGEEWPSWLFAAGGMEQLRLVRERFALARLGHAVTACAEALVRGLGRGQMPDVRNMRQPDLEFLGRVIKKARGLPATPLKWLHPLFAAVVGSPRVEVVELVLIPMVRWLCSGSVQDEGQVGVVLLAKDVLALADQLRVEAAVLDRTRVRALLLLAEDRRFGQFLATRSWLKVVVLRLGQIDGWVGESAWLMFEALCDYPAVHETLMEDPQTLCHAFAVAINGTDGFAQRRWLQWFCAMLTGAPVRVLAQLAAMLAPFVAPLFYITRTRFDRFRNDEGMRERLLSLARRCVDVGRSGVQGTETFATAVAQAKKRQ